MPMAEHKSWLKARDVQAYRSGMQVKIEPASARFMFDTPHDDTGTPMSDHPAVMVAYQLSWERPYQVADGSLAP